MGVTSTGGVWQAEGGCCALLMQLAQLLGLGWWHCTTAVTAGGGGGGGSSMGLLWYADWWGS